MKHISTIALVLCSSATAVAANIYDDCERSIKLIDEPKVNGFASTIRKYPNSTLDNLDAATLCVSAAESVFMTFIPETKTWAPASEVGNGQVTENAEIIEQLLATYLTRVFETESAEAARLEREATAEAAAEEAVRSRICEIKGLVTQYGRTIDEAEAARQDRRIETLSATVQECSTWFDDSPKEALTNDICNSIFAAGGLPNSTISGPSQSEVLLAELSKQNIETELEILLASGMLIEDFMAQYNSDETEDVYGCGQ